MSENLIIHCDKCDSTNVLHEQDMVKPQDVHKKMSEVASDSKKMNMIHDVYYYTHYRMVCKECGHIVRYHK
jgi:predicted nucleic-acid-binding Zn-ribbon protein